MIIDGIKMLIEKHDISHMLRQSLGDKNWDETDNRCKVNNERVELGKALMEAAIETFGEEAMQPIIDEVAMEN